MNYKNTPTENQKQAVLELFYSEFDNSIPRISAMTNVTPWRVNKIINKDLKNRKK